MLRTINFNFEELFEIVSKKKKRNYLRSPRSLTWNWTWRNILSVSIVSKSFLAMNSEIIYSISSE